LASVGLIGLSGSRWYTDRMAVFFYDLLRTTRRGRVVLLRTIYALVLLIALHKLHQNWSLESLVVVGPMQSATGLEFGYWTTDPTAMSKFAEQFARLFLFVQMTAVLVLTPVYTAGAIAEERERGTLDSLLITYLTPVEFVLGKLASRFVQMLGVLLAGLPILALVPLWGGVSPGFVLGWFGLTGLTVLSLGALGICCSARMQSARTAIAVTYAIAALGFGCPLLFFGSPLWLMGSLLNDRMVVGDQLYVILPMAAVLNVFLAVMFIDFAARALVPRMRTDSLFVITPPEPKGTPSLPRWPLLPDEPDFSRRPVGDQAILWKELYVGGSELVRKVMPIIQVFFFALAGLGVVMFVLGVLFSGHKGIQDQLHDIIRGVVVGTLMIAMVGTVLQATASIGRERDQRTLDMLLTLPDGRDEVLRMKWLGSAMCGRWLLPGLGVVLVLGVIGGVVHPAAVPLFAIAAAVHVAFAASLGIYLSIAMPNTNRAAFVAILVLFLACVVPLVLCPGGIGFVPPVAWAFLLPRSWSYQSSTASTFDNSPIVPLAVLLGLVVYACLAGALWLLAVWRFRREGDRAVIA
jgi:ABC-type transport system involved in multi-copper enzyme maturation permease subunit